MQGFLRSAMHDWGLPHQVPWARKYLAGWGYVLSSDVALHIVRSTLLWERSPEEAPGWYSGLHWEDVMVGLIAGEVVGEEPQVRCSLTPHIKVSRAVPHAHFDYNSKRCISNSALSAAQKEWEY